MRTVLGNVDYRAGDAASLVGSSRYLLFLRTFPDAPASLINPTQGQCPLDDTGSPRTLPGNAVTGKDLAALAAAQ